jgi:ArsR family transcriptional regulator, arsenate/arsenite/antimonite-responsive transcriptional repressor
MCQDVYMARQIDDAERLFKALADATRLRILALLATGEVCVCHVHESLRISQPKASRHLAYLRRAGLVATRRQGLWIHYRLAEAPDAVMNTIRLAVAHALGHVDTIRQDIGRLQKRTGCCVPAPTGAPEFTCCGGQRARGSAPP